MKTFVSIQQLLCSFMIIGIGITASSQTVISFDASPDNTMVMKIQDPKLSDKTDKLIIIFDSTTLTCEFSETGIIALHATSHKNNPSEITTSYTYEFSHDQENSNDLLKVVDEHENPLNDLEQEDSLILEDWMLWPNEWM